MLNLTVIERQQLKARAHPLKPTVLIGNAGLTPAVLDEIDRTLKHHDLIKIRAGGERSEREAMLQQICETLNAGAVQHIGKTLVVYRPLEDQPEKKPRRKSKKPQTKKQLAARS
jgi:RNA-binding protein